MVWFFSTKGRANRRQWWLYSIGLSILQLALTYVTTGLIVAWGITPLAYWPGGDWRIAAIELAWMVPFAWLQLCLSIKRSHDRDRSALFRIVYWVFAVISQVGSYIWVPDDTDPALMGALTLYVVLVAVLALALLILLGFLRGTPGPNRYGPPPGGG